MTNAENQIGADPSLLLVDDDEAFLRRLGRAMEKRGFDVAMSETVAEGIKLAREKPPAYAVVDLRLNDGQWVGCCRGPFTRPVLTAG